MDEPNTEPAGRTRVLVVDDEPAILSFLKPLLEKAGYECRTSASAGEALAELQRDGFSLVLTDIMMPGMNGIELLERIKAMKRGIAVVMLTALDTVEHSIRSMKAGAFDYITKPFTTSQVLAAVEKALEKRREVLSEREYQKDLEDRVREQADRIRSSFLNTVETLSYALEAKDPELKEHSRRVTALAVALAGRLGIDEEEVEKIRIAALLHDIGKLGVTDRILDKEEELDDSEIEKIRSHPLVAGKLLAPISELKEIVRFIKHHHERFDGGGYPAGLKGEEIPLGARILAVADSFDAMVSNRSYQEAVGAEAALEELRRQSGGQFDPALVEIMDALAAEGFLDRGFGNRD